ncbi:MAG: hypothetical protein WKF87_07780 [Chryseolinea sp.]
MEGRPYKYLLAFLFSICAFSNAAAQEVNVRSGFFADSVTIGEVTAFYLSARYPANLDILFPDSSFNFAPFEYDRKVYFPTETKDGKSYDSAIYYLSTFEVELVQSLSLPVFQLNSKDSTLVSSPRDSIRLQEYVKDLPDTVTVKNLPLMASTAYEDVPHMFNYPVLFIVVGSLLVVSIVGWLLFGKRIRRHYRIKRLHKSHQKFLETYSGQMEQIKQAFSTGTTENALVHWKKYMEQLESKPYTKLTTRETTRLDNNEPLGKNLHNLDGAIYGHNTNVIESLEHLKSFANQRFAMKLKEVKHG